MQQTLDEHKDVIIDPKTQKRLNEPLKDQTGFNEGHEDFLNMIIKKIENGELDVHNAQTLYNHAVYDNLNEEEKEKADLTAINLISTIRQLESIWKLDKKPTFQIQNIVETIFQMKSKFEDEHGDVYII